MFTILPTALDIVIKTSGVTAVNIRFKNISPKGLSTTAFSPNINPIILPIAIEAISVIENR